jgi:hypothetical protein
VRRRAGSGGVADAIATCMQSMQCTVDKVTEAFGDLLPRQSRAKDLVKLHKIFKDAKEHSLISVFNVLEETREFDEVLMRATINKLKVTPLQKLNKFVSWDRADMVSRQSGELGPRGRGDW